MGDLSNRARCPHPRPRSSGEHGAQVEVLYGVSANTRLAWSVANARRIIGYGPPDDSEVVYADEIRTMMLDPAHQDMVQGKKQGSKGSR